jgi:cell division protein FtsW
MASKKTSLAAQEPWNATSGSLIFCVVLLFSMGLLMVFNTTSSEMLENFDNKRAHFPLIKQLIHATAGCLLAVWIYKSDYHRFLKMVPLFFWIGCLLLICVFIPKIGQTINGAKRWVGLGPVALQPSEFMKIFLPSYYLYFFTELKKPFLLKSFLTILLILGFPIVLILFEPDNGTAGILLVTLVVMFYLTKVRWVYWGMPLGVFALVFGTFASKMYHVTQRIKVYLNPEMDLLGKGHQPYQAKVAAGSGGVFGRGLGNSLQKLNYLPEARSDYIAAIYAEEMGFVGVMFLIALYMFIGYLGFKLALMARDKQGFYLASILTFMICFQAFLNLGVVSGLLPSKGTNLPFFSQGGSSLIANSIMIGFILNVAKIRQIKPLKLRAEL